MPPQQQYELGQLIALTTTMGGLVGSLLGNVDWTTRQSTINSRDWLIATFEGQLDGEALGAYNALLSAIEAYLATFPGGG